MQIKTEEELEQDIKKEYKMALKFVKCFVVTIVFTLIAKEYPVLWHRALLVGTAVGIVLFIAAFRD